MNKSAGANSFVWSKVTKARTVEKADVANMSSTMDKSRCRWNMRDCHCEVKESKKRYRKRSMTPVHVALASP